jgi:hypothetical protein
MRKILLLSASLLALTCTAASAGSITIGLQEDAGATQQFSGGSNFAITGASTTVFQVNNISASTVPTLPSAIPIFDSNALDVRQDSGAAHTLHVFITAQGLMSPAALADLEIESISTSNVLGTAWTVVETTLFDQGNGINSGTVLSSLRFGTNGSGLAGSGFGERFDVTGPFSLTHRYDIIVSDIAFCDCDVNFGSANSTIDQIVLFRRSNSWRRAARPDLGVRWPSRLAATASEDRLYPRIDVIDW